LVIGHRTLLNEDKRDNRGHQTQAHVHHHYCTPNKETKQRIHTMSQFDYHTRQHPQLNQIPSEFRDNDLKQCRIVKDDNIDLPNGLIIERKPNTSTKEYYVKEVTPGGLFHQLHGIHNRIQVGDRLVKINGKPVDEYISLWDINHVLKTSTTLTVHVKRDGLHLQPQREWKPAEYTTAASNNNKSKG
jgi:hypothetical protein